MLADRLQFEAMLQNTVKPIVFVTYEMAGCAEVIEMAEIVAGGADALRERPFVACYINVTTGLLHNADALQKLLFLAEKGLPALYIPVVSGGTSGPMTMAGGPGPRRTPARWRASCISQLKREGAPYVMPGFGGDALDMRTMVDPYARRSRGAWPRRSGTSTTCRSSLSAAAANRRSSTRRPGSRPL